MNQRVRARIPAGPPPLRPAIVHLGLGAFHRAHQAVYLERYRQATGDRSWGLACANLRSSHALVDGLAAAGYRYWVAESHDLDDRTLREIATIRACYFTGEANGRWGRDLASLLSRIADPATRIVTLTVTEKGYGLSAVDDGLRGDDPGVAHDLVHPEGPRTAPAIICAGLARRRRAGAGGLTVVSCDNLPANGRRTRRAVLAFAGRAEPGLTDWIAAQVRFPSSMVDRIVPAMGAPERARLAGLGIDARHAVVCESFAQWVIEDDFAAGRPDWEVAGVEMVVDVTPFETMKLRMLNGTHSLLAYLGALAGIETVAEAVARPAFAGLLRDYLDHEAAPTLEMPAGVDLGAYRDRLLARFGNRSLTHRLQQIAADGSQKLAQRWLAGARAQRAADRPVGCVALGVAAWIRYTAGRDLAGRRYAVDDPMAAELRARHAAHGADSEALVAAFLADRAIFPEALAKDARFAGAVAKFYRTICEQGVEAAIAALPGPGSGH